MTDHENCSSCSRVRCLRWPGAVDASRTTAKPAARGTDGRRGRTDTRRRRQHRRQSTRACCATCGSRRAEVESRPGGEQITLLGELGGRPAALRRSGRAGGGARDATAGECRAIRCGSGQALAELTSPELGRARADYLSAEARVTLAEAALERKRGLAAEKIVPLREVQEAESAGGGGARQRCGPRGRPSAPSASSRRPRMATDLASSTFVAAVAGRAAR